MSAVKLVHEDPGETDPGDTELGQTRERGSARPHDVDRTPDAPDELTDRLIVREPYREDAIGARPKVEARAPHRLLEHLTAISLQAQDVDARVQDDVDPGRARRLTDGAQAFGVLVGVDKAGAAVMVAVLEVAADGLRVQESFDQICGREPIAGL